MIRETVLIASLAVMIGAASSPLSAQEPLCVGCSNSVANGVQICGYMGDHVEWADCWLYWYDCDDNWTGLCSFCQLSGRHECTPQLTSADFRPSTGLTPAGTYAGEGRATPFLSQDGTRYLTCAGQVLWHRQGVPAEDHIETLVLKN